MNKLFLLLGLGLLSFSVACGSGSGNSSFGGGSSSNNKLSGQYAYSMTGIDLTTGSFFREAGVFTADGNGNITAGNDDFAEGTSVFTNTTTGTYTISSDGTGTGTFAFSDGSGLTAAFTVVNSSQVDMIEIDAGATGGGTAWLQTSSAFAAAPSGNFVFRLHTLPNAIVGSVASVGAFSVASGAVSGNEDVNDSGSISSTTITGLFNAPSTTSGRGSGSFTDSVVGTTPFFYYVVNSGTLLLFTQSPGTVGLGRAEAQSTTTFSNASLSGGYAFGSRGDTSGLGIDGVRVAGSLTANGSGTVTAGVYDAVQDGIATPTGGTSFTGTYAVASNGRAVLSLSSGTDIAWLVSPSRAFFLVDDPTVVEDGTADMQSSSSFSNSSFNGTYAFVNDGFTNASTSYDRVGIMTPNGSGNMGLKYALNQTGSSSVVTLTGSYSVAANGRATGSVSNLSSNLVFYLVSSSQAYMLQADTGVEIDGTVTQQQ